MESISPPQLNAWLEKPSASKPLLIDVREPWEADICAIDGAALMPMSALPEAASAIPSEGPIVMVCHHGMRSAQVGTWLERSGRTGVFNLTGGIDAWARQVDQQMATY